MTLLRRLEQAFVLLNQGLVMLMMMTMAALVFTNVVTRYVFGFSLNWAEETSRYLMIWVAYLGAGLAMREGRHVAIEYLQGLLPERLAPYARAVVALLILAFLVTLAVLGVQIAQFAWRQRTPVLGLPQGAVYLAIPIGAGLFVLHFLIVLRDYLRQKPNAVDVEDLAAHGGIGGGRPMTALLLGAFVLLMAIGMPVALVMGAASLVALVWGGSNLPLIILPQSLFRGIDTFPLMAVPLFILAADLMTAGRLTDALLKHANLLVGHLRGGLGYVNVLTSMLFAGISGSALADAAGPGKIVMDMMRRAGYPAYYAGGADGDHRRRSARSSRPASSWSSTR
jgi:TRAP-type transport system small permease protein